MESAHYEINQVIYIVTKQKDGELVIVPMQVVAQSTVRELKGETIDVKVSYRVSTGNGQSYDLADVKGSQFTTLDDAIESLRLLWEKKLAVMRTNAEQAEKRFGKSALVVSSVIDDTLVDDDHVVVEQDVEHAPGNGQVKQRVRIDMASIERAIQRPVADTGV